MQFRWFDHSAKENAPGLEHLANLMKLLDSADMGSLQLKWPPDDLDEALLVVHPGTAFGGMHVWERWANPERRRFVLFVSSARGGKTNVPGTHKLQVSLSSATRCLTAFADQFRASLGTGQPNWDLLEPSGAPQALVAGYLIRLAEENGLHLPPDCRYSTDSPEWNRVTAAYREVAAAFGLRPVEGVPTREAMRAALEAVRRQAGRLVVAP